MASDDTFATPFDTPLTVPAPGVLANDTDPDGDPLTVALATGPANGTVTLNEDGSFTYTPNAGFSGTDSVTYTATDTDGETSTATVTITVAAEVPTMPGDCTPGHDGAKPGYGHGDKNHRHCGPPGRTGDRPGNAEGQGVDGRPVASTSELPPPWLLAGLGLLFLASLLVPFGPSRRGDRQA